MIRRDSGRVSALLVLAACFFASGLLRAGEVVAALPENHGSGSGQTAEPTVAEPKIGALATELRRQRAALADREVALEERAQSLELIESRLRERLLELAAAQSKLEETAVLVDDAAGKDIRHLVAMYEQMKPKQAAQIFNAMAPTFAAGFLGQMSPQTAALVLANMDAEKAYSVSLLMAGRNLEQE